MKLVCCSQLSSVGHSICAYALFHFVFFYRYVKQYLLFTRIVIKPVVLFMYLFIYYYYVFIYFIIIIFIYLLLLEYLLFWLLRGPYEMIRQFPRRYGRHHNFKVTDVFSYSVLQDNIFFLILINLRRKQFEILKKNTAPVHLYELLCYSRPVSFSYQRNIVLLRFEILNIVLLRFKSLRLINRDTNFNTQGLWSLNQFRSMCGIGPFQLVQWCITSI